MNLKIKILIGILVIMVIGIISWRFFVWTPTNTGSCKTDSDCEFTCGCGCILKNKICPSYILCKPTVCGAACYCQNGKCKNWGDIYSEALKTKNIGLCNEIQNSICKDYCIESLIKDETADCLEKYPLVEFKDCIPGEVVDGWWGTILYPNTLDTSSIEHYIDAPAPDIVKQVGIASYGASPSTCQTNWFIKIDGEWKEVSQFEFCNYIIDYNSSCDNCLLEWGEGCC